MSNASNKTEYRLYDIHSLFSLEAHTVAFWFSLYTISKHGSIDAGMFDIEITVGTDGIMTVEVYNSNSSSPYATYRVATNNQWSLDKPLSGYRVA